ncbi:MAG TPA: hypothetical protein PKN54_10590 [Candidatus Cloacimonas acidaminovorans]|nr:hypothetical protein [Candidatus Cloacimonas acidaminovorans]
MDKAEYLHRMKKVATIIKWIKERGVDGVGKRRTDYLCYKTILDVYDLLDKAYKYLPEGDL